MLDRWAPLAPAPLCPEVLAFQGLSLVRVWEAAEAVAGQPLPAPFWAYAWAAGCALARVILDRPSLVEGRRVLDVGCGGGVTALAAARAGAAEVVANDVDPWALATLALAAERQHLAVTPLLGDLTREPLSSGSRRRATGAGAFDVVLCGDLAYERSQADPQRALLHRYLEAGSHVLAADAERAYFVADGLQLLAEYRVPVPRDLEGVDVRTARVYQMS